MRSLFPDAKVPATLPPNDDYNRALRDNVHPAGWMNLEPTGRYHLVIIGAGPAGLVTAAIGAELGAKVALIEKDFMGGDCLNVGCVPSKGLIAASRAWAKMRCDDEFGISIPAGTKYDFSVAMARMQKLRARMSANDSAQRFKALGVDLFFGEGCFTGADTVLVDGKILTFKKAAICTGARATRSNIPGLENAGYLTNETLFTLTDLPPRMAVIGAGPLGCEMAQTFARFHSKVSLFVKGNHILPREDADAAKVVEDQMRRDGISLVFNANITRVMSLGKEKSIHYKADWQEKEQVVDTILLCIGRTPNLKGLGLKAVGVQYDLKSGILINDLLQTTNPNIFSAGDVCSPFQFTHTADAMAKILIQNALFPHPFGLGYAKASAMVIPWCTYTSPEIAHVGIIEEGIEMDTFTCSLSAIDRAILDGEEEGFARIYLAKGTDTLLGATIVSAHAGEIVSALTLAIKEGIGLSAIAETIYPYPTQSEVIKKVANEWKKSSFTKQKKNILRTWFKFTR